MIVSCTYLLPNVDLLGAVITTAGLVDALVLVGSSTKIAALLCLESLYIVILPIYLHMSGASLVAALFGNVAHDAITKLANFRTDIFASFEGADADNCVADQVAVTNGPAEEQTNEEECLGIQAVQSLAEALYTVQLFSASVPKLILVTAFDDAIRVGGMTDDCSTIEETAQIAARHAWGHLLGGVFGLVPCVVVRLVVEQDDL